MHSLHHAIFVASPASCSFAPFAARIENPIKGVEDAIRKAKEDAARQRQQQEARLHAGPQNFNGNLPVITQDNALQTWEMGADGTLTFLAPDGPENIQHVRITLPARTSGDSLPAEAQGLQNAR